MAYTTINKSTDYFTTATWSGTGSQQTISLPFQADWIWVKRRNSSANHAATKAYVDSAVAGSGEI